MISVNGQVIYLKKFSLQIKNILSIQLMKIVETSTDEL